MKILITDFNIDNRRKLVHSKWYSSQRQKYYVRKKTLENIH